MRNHTVAVKATVGLGILLLASLVLVAFAPCDDCDSQTISASAGDDQPTDDDTPPTTAAPRGALAGDESPFVGLADGRALAIVTDEATGLGTADGQDAGDDEAAAIAGAEGADAGDGETGPTTTVAGAGSDSGSDTTDGAGNPAPDDETTTTAPPTTVATTAAPIRVPPSGEVPANGTTYYVSAYSGNDGNDGRSESTAWRSLQTGLRQTGPGDTLLVMNGQYTELKAAGIAHYTVDEGGQSGNWKKIAAYPGHSPEIVASNGTGLLVISPYVEVSGLTIRGTGFNQGNNYGSGIAMTGTHDVRVVGNRISGMPLTGISATDSSRFEIIGNEVFNNSYWSPLQGSGISVWHSRNKGLAASSDGYHDRIVGNIVYGNENKVNSSHSGNVGTITDGNGIIIDSNDETGYTGRTLIANNVTFYNGGRGIITWRADRVDIMFNTSFHNGQTDGIAGGATEFAAGRANDVIIANNVGWSRPGLPAIIFDRVSNGRSYGNVLVTDSPSGHASSNDLMHSGNPGFRNPTGDPRSADFRPTSGSVLLGRAIDPAWFIGSDRVGTSRAGGTPDVGAYQVEAASR